MTRIDEEKSKPCFSCRDGLVLLSSALALRVAWALLSRRFWGYSEDGLYDDGAFLEIARGFLRGAAPLSHPPGYPLLLAAFLSVGGWGVSLARWAQMMASAALPVLTYRAALSLRLTRSAALAAGLFVAFNPMLIYFSVRIMSETLYVALVLAFFAAWTRAWNSSSLKSAAFAGALGAAAALTRGIILPFGGVLALVAFLRRREQPRWAPLVAVCGLAWAAAMAPWTAYNWTRYHRFIPVSVQGGWNFYEGLGDDADAVRLRPLEMAQEARRLGLNDIFALNAHFGAKAASWIKAHPAAFLRICAAKALHFWRPFPGRPHSAASRVLSGLLTVILFAAALLGLRETARAPGAWFLFAWALYVNLIHSVFASTMRYRLPIEPTLAVSAGAGVAALLRRGSKAV